MIGRFCLAGFCALSLVPSIYGLYIWLKIRSLRARVGTKGAVDFAFGGGFPVLFPLQQRAEIEGFLGSLRGAPPQVVVEIGAAFGGTLFLLCRAASPDALIVSIDLPGGGFVGPFGKGGYGQWRTPFIQAFAGPGQKLHLVRADSHNCATHENLERLLGGRAIDLLFIDGDHSYAGVRQDFEMYSHLVRPGGLVAFHDINPGPEEFGGGVSRWWSEVKQGRQHYEIVADAARECFGIGVLKVDKRAI